MSDAIRLDLIVFDVSDLKSPSTNGQLTTVPTPPHPTFFSDKYAAVSMTLDPILAPARIYSEELKT